MPTYRVTDAKTGRKLKLTGDSPPTEQELIDIFDSQPEIQPDEQVGIAGKVSLPDYQAGERNIAGNTFERPAAAIRGGIDSMLGGQGFTKGYQEQSINPNTPTYQQRAGDAVARQPGLLDAGKFVGQAAASLVPGHQFLGIDEFGQNMGETAVRTTAELAGSLPDYATNPAQIAATLAGGPLGKLLGKTKVGAQMVKLGQTPLGMPAPKIPTLAKMESMVDTNYMKAIKPTASSIGRQPVKQYLAKVRQGVGAIVEHKDALRFVDDVGDVITGKLPRTVQQFEEATNQTLKSVFNQYDELAKSAGESGIRIDTKPAIDQLESVLNNSAMKDFRPEVLKYAQARIDALKARGTYSPQEVQDLIAVLNRDLKGFFKNPNYSEASKAVVDDGIVKILRSELDKAIYEATGEQYQPLKNLYGSIASIQRDVARASAKQMRNTHVPIFEEWATASGSGDILRGLLTFDPARTVQGGAKIGYGMFSKWKNAPNRMVKQMFEVAENHAKQIGKTPVSGTLEYTMRPSAQKLITNQAKGQKALPYRPSDPVPPGKLGEMVGYSPDDLGTINRRINAQVESLKQSRRILERSKSGEASSAVKETQREIARLQAIRKDIMKQLQMGPLQTSAQKVMGQ